MGHITCTYATLDKPSCLEELESYCVLANASAHVNFPVPPYQFGLYMQATHYWVMYNSTSSWMERAKKAPPGVKIAAGLFMCVLGSLLVWPVLGHDGGHDLTSWAVHMGMWHYMFNGSYIALVALNWRKPSPSKSKRYILPRRARKRYRDEVTDGFWHDQEVFTTPESHMIKNPHVSPKVT